MNNALQKIRPVESPVTLIVPFILAFEPFLRRSSYRSWSSRLFFHCLWRFYSSAVGVRSSRLLFHCSWRFYSSVVCACVTPWLCVTFESACVCVCGLRAAIDWRRAMRLWRPREPRTPAADAVPKERRQMRNMPAHQAARVTLTLLKEDKDGEGRNL